MRPNKLDRLWAAWRAPLAVGLAVFALRFVADHATGGGLREVAAVLVAGGICFAAGMLLEAAIRADRSRRSGRGRAAQGGRGRLVEPGARAAGASGASGASGVAAAGLSPEERPQLALADLDLDAMDIAAAHAMAGGR